MTTSPLTQKFLHGINADWRAANSLTVGHPDLDDTPRLKRPLAPFAVKLMLLGTPPGQHLTSAHLNRVIKKYNVDMIHVAGPGHGGPAA